ncbi:MAG: hypothetical protein KME45_27450 [Stenomitos rutilans HA7619-LM2]|jgi:hypothetical protein|nr:hypothetical protein [Stenomitos rutilans HA7619-LM2]
MNLSPALQRAIEQIASSQGISTDEFIIQTLTEKVSSFHKPSPSSTSQTGLRDENGILVFGSQLGRILFSDNSNAKPTSDVASGGQDFD